MHDVDSLRLAEQEKRPNGSPPTIGIMVVTPEKGLRMYQRILPRLLERWPEAEVLIAGSSSYPQELAHHPNARILGYIDAATFFARIDVHLILFETTGSWGRVIGEAGLFGVPTVTSDVGSQKEALGEGGILVDDGHDTDAVIDALMAVYDDRERYGELRVSILRWSTTDALLLLSVVALNNYSANYSGQQSFVEFVLNIPVESFYRLFEFLQTETCPFATDRSVFQYRWHHP